MTSPSDSSGRADSEATALDELRALVTQATGIQFNGSQRSFVRSRITRRAHALGLRNMGEYLAYISRNHARELPVLISLATTHHTSFFREFAQFEFLLDQLPTIVQQVKAEGRNKIEIWSAACSLGQEAYTIAMFMEHHLSLIAPGIGCRVLGTDIDSLSIDHARNGVYRLNEIQESPADYLKNHWIRGTEEISAFVKAGARLRHMCEFGTLNLLAPGDDLQGRSFDLIFCRNVLIYFSADQTRVAVRSMLQHLKPHGLFLTGASETLNGLDISTDRIGPSVYVPRADAPKAQVPRPTKWQPKRIRLLCVDDSPTVLSLLQKAFVADSTFEVVATASNGIEAAEKLSRIQVDAMTLDLQMPGMSGLQYLQTHMRPDHPPVIIVSTLSREGEETAREALKSGATDYVEKPVLQDFQKRAEELRSKIRAAVTKVQGKATPALKSTSATAPVPLLNGKKRVLIVDDSPSMRVLLRRAISEAPGLEVVGEAARGEDLLSAVRAHKPDVITLDLFMPGMGGLTAFERLMATQPVPTVIVSSIAPERGGQVLAAIEKGAFDHVQKVGHPDGSSLGAAVVEKVLAAAAAGIKAFKRSSVPRALRARPRGIVNSDWPYELIAVGASTGGPEALKQLLSKFPEDTPPILVVQHIPAFFSQALAKRLDELCPFEVREAVDGEELRAGLALVAPGGKQMSIERKGGKLRVKVREEPAVNRHCPSVDVLFKAVAHTCGAAAAGILLTGMGADGADGLLEIRKKGGRTFVESEESCVIYGMPKEAIARGAAETVRPLNRIHEAVFAQSLKRRRAA